MSTDYYTRLEQQRGPQPSEQPLASLARALRLTHGERDYLFQVAGRNAPTAESAAAHVAPALLRMLDRLADTPALLVLTAPPRTQGYEKLQLLAVLGHEHFTDVSRS